MMVDELQREYIGRTDRWGGMTCGGVLVWRGVVWRAVRCGVCVVCVVCVVWCRERMNNRK